MPKQHFARLDLERLEEVALPNMIVGPIPLSPSLEIPASEVQSLRRPDSPTTIGNYAHVHQSILTPSSQTTVRLPSLRSHNAAHFGVETAPNKARNDYSSFAFSADDLTDSLKVDLFGIDSLVGSKPRGLSAVGRDSGGLSTAIAPASNPMTSNGGAGSPAPNRGISGGAASASRGNMPFSNIPLVPGTLLLSPGHTVALVPGGSQEITPVSPLASGPNIGGGQLTLGAPAYVPVNADDDNGSDVTNGIPAKRDFNVAPLKVNDQDLQAATLTAVGLPPGGSWSSLLNTPGKGNIALWKDQMKTAPFQLPAQGQQGTFNFYIEGVHESSAQNDVKLTFYYIVGTPPNQQIYSASASMTVTPLITTFGVTPNADAGDPNGQNVGWSNGNNGNGGLQAKTPDLEPGALFKGVAVQTGLNGDMRFIQNVMGLDNGYNGTKNGAGANVGWLFADGTSSNLGLINGTFPVLDIIVGSPDQTYALSFVSTISPDGSTITITANDTPYTGHPGNAQNGVAEDVRFRFQQYLVWRWKQTVNGSQVSVFYPLAYTKWQVNFYAKGTVVNGVLTAPINKIVVLNGVSSDGGNTYTPWNDPPPQLDMTKIYNGNNKWS